MSPTASTRGPGETVGDHEYEALLAAHSSRFQRLEGPTDEWDAIAVSYTSGTTGDPKGVVTHHRGAYLNAVCNARHVDHAALSRIPVDVADVPLQRLVLSRGRCAMLGGTHVCLRRVDARPILDAMREHGVDHYCGAPIVHNLIVNAPAEWREGIAQACAAWSPARRRRPR